MAIMAGLGAAQVLVRRPTLTPLYIPVGPVVATVLFTAVIRTVLGTVFGQLELKNIGHQGRDRVAERAAMRRPVVKAVVLGVAAVVLILPSVHVAFVAGMSQAYDWTIAAGVTSTIEGGLASVDPMGLLRLTTVTISRLVGEVQVTISEDGRTVRNVTIVAGTTWSWSPDVSRRVLYAVSMMNPTATIARFQLTIVRDAFPELFAVVPAALVAVAAANVASFLRLRAVAQHYRPGSAGAVLTGETVLASRGHYGLEEGFRTKTPFLNLPPRPPTKLPAVGESPSGPVTLLHTAPTAKTPTRAPIKPRPPSAVARSRPPDDPETLLREAARREAQGNLEGALKTYDAILRRTPGHPATSLAKANVLRRLNRGPDALGVYRQLLRADRYNLDALRGCLAIHEADEAWRDALDVADRIVAVRPDDAYLQAMRGDILAALQLQPEAVAAYQRAVALRPGDTTLIARANRIRADIPLLLSHAFVSSGSGDFAAALATFDNVLRLEKDNLDARAGKSGVLRKLGRVVEARALLERVLAQDPTHSAALLTKAQLLAETGDLRGSLVALDALLSVDPEDPDALLERGDILARMGRTDDAHASYEAALKLHPDDRDATEKLKALAGGEKTDRAVLRELFRIRGLGPAKAQAILAAGFRTVEDLRRATVDELGAVRGVERKLAEVIVRHFHKPQ